LLYTFEHSCCPLRIGLFEILEPGTKAFRIERADRKRPNAALRAARVAHQPWTAAPSCIRELCIYDLY
jgi:hypothetical protein